jgi:alkylhydroperoxidase family enzyme
MPKIPYASLSGNEPKDVQDLIDAIRARRGGKALNLDRVLVHSPPFADGWNTFFRKLRNELSLDAKLRELAICAVGVLNGADYELHHHIPEFHKAGGTPDQITALYAIDDAAKDADVFNAAERAIIRLSIEMTRDISATPETLEAVKALLPGTQQVMEAIGVIAAYNMVSRILLTAGVELEE